VRQAGLPSTHRGRHRRCDVADGSDREARSPIELTRRYPQMHRVAPRKTRRRAQAARTSIRRGRSLAPKLEGPLEILARQRGHAPDVQQQAAIERAAESGGARFAILTADLENAEAYAVKLQTADAIEQGYRRVEQLKREVADGRRARLMKVGFSAMDAADVAVKHTRNFI
jgi:hypothetical protein